MNRRDALDLAYRSRLEAEAALNNLVDRLEVAASVCYEDDEMEDRLNDMVEEVRSMLDQLELMEVEED